MDVKLLQAPGGSLKGIRVQDITTRIIWPAV